MDLDGLRRAAEEAAWLVSRGYEPLPVAAFVAEQRCLSAEDQALFACATRLRAEYAKHIARELEPEDVAKRPLRIDASSVLAAVDAGLAGRPLLESPAGVLADPSWQRPGAELESLPGALERIETALRALRTTPVRWYVDESAPWAAKLLALLSGSKAKVTQMPDVAAALAGGAHVASSDPIVLDAVASWLNLPARALAGTAARPIRLEG